MLRRNVPRCCGAPGDSHKKQRAARITAMGLDDEALRHIRRAVTALAAKADAETRQKALELEAVRAGKDITENTYRVVIAIGQIEAMRQTRSLESGHTLPEYLSMKKFYDHTAATLETDPALQTDKWKLRTYENNAAKFWKLLEYLKDDVEHTGATLAADAFDKANWSKVGCSQFAELSTLAFILAPAFEAAFFGALKKTGKNVTDLENDVTGYVKPKPKAKAFAKKPRRRSKKAAPEPTETTEAAETTPPKAKAPARRARRRGRRREDDDDDDFAPPPKAKAEDDDEIETAVGEAAPTRLNLMVANEVLRRDLAARDEELAAARAEIAAYKEQIKKKEADKKFVEEMTIRPLKKRLAAVRDKLAREMAKNKFLSAAVCPRTSPLCDATNA